VRGAECRSMSSYFLSGAVMNQVPSILVLQYFDRFGVELEPDLEVKTLNLFVQISIILFKFH
jgi:hypothetical protein